MNNNYFPIFISLDDFRALVIGGGKVAFRKVKNLLEFNSKVRIVSPVFCKELEELIVEGKIVPERKHYNSDDIDGYRFIFSCTDNPETDKLVYDDAIKAGALINVADNPELCNFIMPAFIKQGNLTIAISSQAKSPFYTKHIKEQLKNSLSRNISEIIELAGEFRKLVLNNENFDSSEKKNEAFARFLDIDWEQIISSKGLAEAYRLMGGIINI